MTRSTFEVTIRRLGGEIICRTFTTVGADYFDTHSAVLARGRAYGIVRDVTLIEST